MRLPCFWIGTDFRPLFLPPKLNPRHMWHFPSYNCLCQIHGKSVYIEKLHSWYWKFQVGQFSVGTHTHTQNNYSLQARLKASRMRTNHSEESNNFSRPTNRQSKFHRGSLRFCLRFQCQKFVSALGLEFHLSYTCGQKSSAMWMWRYIDDHKYTVDR